MVIRAPNHYGALPGAEQPDSGSMMPSSTFANAFPIYGFTGTQANKPQARVPSQGIAPVYLPDPTQPQFSTEASVQSNIPAKVDKTHANGVLKIEWPDHRHPAS